MQDHHTTSGSHQPDVDDLLTVEQVLLEAAKELPPINLPGGLTVAAEIMPFSLGRLHPVCSRITEHGEHRIPTQFVWKDMETNEVFCHLVCAAREAIARADRGTDDVYPTEPRA